MKAAEQLSQDHEAIKLMLQILEKICDKLESKEKVDPKHLEQILEFIKIFADKCHHGKEEELLFPAMEKVGIPKEGGPIGMMLEEHNMGRGYVKGMGNGIVKYTMGDYQAGLVIAENAQNYITLLAEHIDKENNILYPMTDIHLAEKDQKELLEGFEKIERERIGVGKHEEFHKLLERLKGIYLK